MRYLKRKILIVVSLFICAIMAFTLFACTPQPSDTTGSNDGVNDNVQDETNSTPEDEVENPKGENQQTQPELPNDEDTKLSQPDEKEPEYDSSKVEFADVGEKYQEVIQPFISAAEYILDDLVELGEIARNAEGVEKRNTHIVCIRYFSGRSLTIELLEDIYISETGEKSEFLQHNYSINLENFGEYDESAQAFEDFLRIERKSQLSENYVEIVLPFAEKSAEMILAQYENYRSNPNVKISEHGKPLILKADSSLSETYNKIVENLNISLKQRNMPQITDQDLEISFGGNISWDIVHRWIIIKVCINNLRYTYYLSFNDYGEFSKEYINHYEGSPQSGYTTSNPDLLCPRNEEFAELFKKLKIEEMDLSDLDDHYGYQGKGNGLYSSQSEWSYLYF